MPKALRRTVFGNPLLRRPAAPLTPEQITSPAIRELITNMYYTLGHKQYGVGLAAPQIGRGLAIIVVGIKPTPARPNRKPYQAVYINPKITKYYGSKQPEWEGCISLGSVSDPIFAQAERHPKIDIQYLDEHGKPHEETVDSFLAHVLQHEVDHLNGVLFVDHVKDTTTYMNAREYRKLILKG